MNRTLRRPMFRMGGSTEGITSGLQAPRQGYATNEDNLVKKNDLSKIDIRNMDLKQLKDLAKQISYKPRGTNINDFLISMGLDLVSRPQAGNIFQQVATSAREPYKEFVSRKQTADEQEYASEADMFKTLIGAQADILSSESGGKTYAKLEIANDIERTMTEILQLEKRAEGGEDVTTELNKKKARLNYLSKENAIGKSLMQQTDFAEDVLKSITTTLVNEKIPDPNNPELMIPKYKGKKDPELLKEAFRQYAKFFQNVPEPRTDEADGGRIGYQQGLSVQPTEISMGQAPMNMDQGTEEPKIDYATLRERLPEEITDDIVRLISASPEALEDFATIATQQDVNNFNKKYSVNLVLPAEA